MLYDTFWFDYHAFRIDVAPIVDALDRGDQEILRVRVSEILHNISPEDWILENRGTTLEADDVNVLFDGASIGYALLIVLSTYLEPARPSFSTPAYLQRFLLHIGWTTEDVHSVVYGDTPSSILKPRHSTTNNPWSSSTDYRDHIRPTQANQCGWLSSDRIKLLSKQLREADTAAQAGSFQPEPCLPSQSDVHQALGQVIEMFEAACAANKGLYLIYS